MLEKCALSAPGEHLSARREENYIESRAESKRDVETEEKMKRCQ
jgi:hypothetical protein